MRIGSIIASGVPIIESVPGRSGIEPDVASPFGSLILVSVSIPDHSIAIYVRPPVVKNSWSGRGNVGTLTVLDDGLVVLDRLQGE